VCTLVYKHTHTHHPNTRKNRKIYKTKPLSLPLSKHSLPRQEQALTMNKLEKPPLPIPRHTRMQVLRNTCDTLACSREIGQSRYKKTNCAYTSAYVHPHARVYKCICINMHRHTYTHIRTYTHAPIHAYMHTHIHTHAYAHVCTDKKS